MASAQQRLDEVRASIKELLEKGQSVSKGDRRLDRASLASLRMLEEQYAVEAARESRDGRPRQIRLYSRGKGA
ncbi:MULTISPECIES: hypothetical protein [Stutzerimonas stutzeri group]|jgi:hypothetical protein|uniref:hypothetical protein n=1 Tax=Stutzerimonas stutzeri group TaxID=136846 RepID=UPI000C6E3B38|nr:MULTISPECIES: hypothetical protein [Stutzerimonas stutzeri group]MBU0789351.1 hypothetical protein [Gammaproteobacteria bacterium]MBK3748711.1 hypothetical protein [Stutzerimonas balearica]MBK3826908.1 hypothetical protein [Stutzerimonas balearica]MBK3856598.1 hypothetical protein [Stutzerimonas balearica]MBU1806374.1 hypothetical protein [Gammaproteobacteria bacterium]